MSFQVFDLLYVEPDQVKEFLTAMAKEGLVAGVYLWFNKSNGHMYVGSSVNLYSRISGYLSFSKLHGIIGNALLKYSLDSFVLVIFFVPNATSSLVLSLEQSVLDSCVCAYNILPVAGSSAGFKHTDETKAKIGAANKGNTYRKGNRLSEETKAKLSEGLKGNKNRQGTNHSEETLAKMSASQQGENNSNFNKGKAVYLYVVHCHGFELTATFSNAVRCSETLGIPYTTLVNRIKNRTLFEINGLQHIVSRDGNLGS